MLYYENKFYYHIRAIFTMPLASIGLCKKVLKELFCVKPKQNFNRTIQVKIKKKEHE